MTCRGISGYRVTGMVTTSLTISSIRLTKAAWPPGLRSLMSSVGVSRGYATNPPTSTAVRLTSAGAWSTRPPVGVRPAPSTALTSTNSSVGGGRRRARNVAHAPIAAAANTTAAPTKTSSIDTHRRRAGHQPRLGLTRRFASSHDRGGAKPSGHFAAESLTYEGVGPPCPPVAVLVPPVRSQEAIAPRPADRSAYGTQASSTLTSEDFGMTDRLVMHRTPERIAPLLVGQSLQPGSPLPTPGSSTTGRL